MLKRLQQAIREYLAEAHTHDCVVKGQCSCGREQRGETLLAQAANRLDDLEPKED